MFEHHLVNLKPFIPCCVLVLHIFISNHFYTLVKLTHQTRFGPNWATFSDTLIKSEVPHLVRPTSCFNISFLHFLLLYLLHFRTHYILFNLSLPGLAGNAWEPS
jgi:hypothetical protein